MSGHLSRQSAAPSLSTMAESPSEGGAVEACAMGENGGVMSSSTFLSFAPIKPHLVVEAPRAVEAIHFYKKVEEVKTPFHPTWKADQGFEWSIASSLKVIDHTAEPVREEQPTIEDGK